MDKSKDKEHINDLIVWYQAVIDVINLPVDMWEVKCFLKETKTNAGVCKCAAERFGFDLYNRQDLIGWESWWYDQPGGQISKAKVIECLQFRLDKLKTIYNEILINIAVDQQLCPES